MGATIQRRWREVVRVVRQIIGIPDYDRYVSHLRRVHPECAPLSREAFLKDRMEARYNRPGSRCC
jgi:uncharacterized short protein YbdD (DUF466 family)